VRIIAGRLRGRTLLRPGGDTTRPTSDRVREALASALEARGAFAGARVLDLFAGTGALGLEALSRGAASLVAVERDRRALECLRQNVAALEVGERTRVLALDVLGNVSTLARALDQTALSPFGLVLCDPPYAQVDAAVRVLDQLAERGLFAPAAVLALEHAARTVPERPARFEELADYAYGDTGIRLWQAIAVAPDS
jgi:16S rRNA (guanine966-N2)-methyltransferase